MQKLTQRFKNIFTLDTKSLAIMRIAVWLMMILYLGDYLINIERIYGHDAIITSPIAWSKYYWSNIWQFHIVSDASVYIYTLFFFHFLLVLAFIAWYRLNIVKPLLWMFTVSLQSVNILVINSFDWFLAVSLLWFIFLPLWENYSYDIYKKTNNRRGNNYRYFWAWSVWFIISLLVIYSVSASFRWNLRMHQDNILWKRLQFYTRTTPLWIYVSKYIYSYAFLPKILVCIESFLRVFFLIPYKQSFFRNTSIILAIIFHIFIFLFIDIGLFPLWMIAIWLWVFRYRSWSSYYYHKSSDALYPLLSRGILCYVILWNANIFWNMLWKHDLILPAGFHKYWNLLYVNFSRTMFWWDPKTAIWYKIEWVPSTGTSIDVMTQETFDDTYTSSYETFLSERKRKFLVSMGSNERLHNDMLRYYCNRQDITALRIRIIWENLDEKQKIFLWREKKVLFEKECNS